MPQNRENNQRLWSRIETAVRKIAMSYDDTYVVTGPIFSGQQLQTIGPTRVFVPTQSPDRLHGEGGPSGRGEHPVRLGLHQLDVRGLEQQIADLFGQSFGPALPLCPGGLRFLSTSNVNDLFVFPVDMQRVAAEPNRLNNQVLVRYYEEEWKDVAH